MVTFFPMLRKEKSSNFYAETELFTQEVVQCVSYLRETLHHYCDNNHDLAKEAGKKVISQESKADATRRRIEKKLYQGVLIHMGTSDKYALLEAIDDIADKAEILVRVADISKIDIPKIIVRNYREMANKVELSAKLLGEAVTELTRDVETAIKKASKLEIIREQVRETEFTMLKKLFEKQQTTKAILLKEIITLTGQVTDKAEEAADRVISLGLKYQS
ncbi:MAG: DUF47 family protein [archaeon]